MHNRIMPVLGGVGLFAALYGFVAASASPDAADGLWATVMVLGLVAFLWSVFDRTARRPDKS